SASTLAATHTSITGAALLPCLILLVPIFDIFLVSITRRIQNRAISEGARDHSSHRLVFLGLSERRSVSVLHSMAFLAGMQALLWTRFPVRWMGSLVALFLLGVLHFWLYMTKLEIPEDWLSRVFVPSLPGFLQHSGAKPMRAFLDAALSALGLYFI